jgi:predicted nucleotidyltransferase
VLRLLFADHEHEVYLRQLERQSSVTLRSLQQELETLEKGEVVCARRDGNRLYYSANRQHPLYPELKSLSVKTFGIVPVLRQALQPLHGVTLAFVFGSQASSKAKPHSDIDLMILGNISFRQLASALKNPTDTLAREINPIICSPTEWKKHLQKKHPFFLDIKQKKKLWILGQPHELKKLEK